MFFVKPTYKKQVKSAFNFSATTRKIAIYSLVVVCLHIVLNSCSTLTDRPLSEGVIEYSVTYPDSLSKPLKYDPSLRPDKMIVKFKNNKTISVVQGLSGAISFSFIQNPEKSESVTLIKLFNKKFFFKEVFNDTVLPLLYYQMPKLIILPLDEATQWLGFKCKNAEGRFLTDSLLPFSIMHTHEIAIDNPNIKTPYEPIDGVLLRFRVRLWGQTMQLEAVQVKHENINDSDFLIPSDHEAITKETLNDILALVQ